MFAITQDGKRLVGHLAKRQAITNARNTVYAAQAPDRAALRLARGAARDRALPLRDRRGPERRRAHRARGQDLHVPEIAAIILREMKRIAEEYLGEPVREAVVTVPALLQRRPAPGTKDAGQIAGPRGPAHHQRADRGRAGLRLRQAERGEDRGLRPRRRHLRHLDPRDRRRACSRCSRPPATPSSAARTSTAASSITCSCTFQEREGIDLRSDPMALQRLKDAAEKAKCELSHARDRPRSTCRSSPRRERAAPPQRRRSTRETLEGLVARHRARRP